MKQHWPMAVLTVIGVVATALALTTLIHPREPVYGGQPLSFWLDQIDTQQPGQAQDAIRAIGPKAVPFLLEKVRTENAFHHKHYHTIWIRLPETLQTHLPTPRRAGPLHARIVAAFRLLGRRVIPDLVAALGDRDVNVRLVAIGGITGLGPKASAAVPALIKLVNDSNAEVRFSAVLALRYMGTEAVQAIPALTAALNDNAVGPRRAGHDDVQVRDMAAQVLGRIGPDARMAVPELRRILSDTNAPTRQAAMLALWRIEHDTNLVSQAIAEVDYAPDALTCKRFLEVLGAMRSAATPAVPAVLRAITNSAQFPNRSTTDVSRAVRIALRKIDPVTAAKFAGQGR